MPNFRKNPYCNETENSPIENGGEMHLPCVVLVDTSTSMDRVKQQLQDGLATLADSLDDQAKGRVEFSIITFDDDARVLVPFGPSYDYEVPRLTCGGMTAEHKALDLGLKVLQQRTAEYKANKTAYYRGWMFILTDGCANDPDNGAVDRILQAQDDKHLTVFPVAIGNNVDKEFLKTLRHDGLILTASKENFSGAFVWLSNSLSITSITDAGGKATLPNAKDYQLEIEVA